MKPEAFSRREWRFRCKQLNECGRSVLGCPPRRGLVLGGATQGGQGDAKTLHVLRHQATEMAAYMGMHRYGSPHTEPLRDPMLYDTRLTRAGRQKAAELAASISSLQPPPQLVLVSPLTRCLETASLALGLPLSQGPDSRGGEDSLSGASSGSGVASGAAPLYRPPLHAPVVAEPLLRERVTLSSEVGRPAALLRRDFTAVDFSRVEAAAAAAGRRQRWWWTGPTGADNLGPDDYDDAEASTSSSSSRGGSGAPGAAPRPKSMSRTVVKEPEDVYAARIAELKELLAARPERVILLVSHWGVIQQLTGISLEPGELETCEGWTPPQQQPQP